MRKSSCADYRAYVQPSLFSKQGEGKIRKTPRKRKTEVPKREGLPGQEQMFLGLA